MPLKLKHDRNGLWGHEHSHTKIIAATTLLKCNKAAEKKIQSTMVTKLEKKYIVAFVEMRDSSTATALFLLTTAVNL